MTLFSVGFKVDAKADVTFVGADGSKEIDFSDENATVYAKVSGTIPKELSHDYTVYLPNDDVPISVGYDEDTKEYSLLNKDDFYDYDVKMILS